MYSTNKQEINVCILEVRGENIFTDKTGLSQKL